MISRMIKSNLDYTSTPVPRELQSGFSGHLTVQCYCDTLESSFTYLLSDIIKWVLLQLKLDTEKALKIHSFGGDGSRNSVRIGHLMGPKWHFHPKQLFFLYYFLQIIIIDCKGFSFCGNSNEEKTLVNWQKKVCYFPYFPVFFLSAHFSPVCVVELVLW